MTRPAGATISPATRTLLWLGALAFGVAGCTLQIPEGLGAPAPTPEAEAPRPLNFTIPTGDNADRVQVVSKAGVNPGGTTVRLCLELVGLNWWKGLGVGRTEPTLEVQDSKKVACTDVEPGQVPVTFWKAKTFGVHTQLSSAILNLAGYAGHGVTLRWSAD
jgi:hypothetical protein